MKFWKNKRVLVTGSEGFVGKHLVDSLKKKGAKVIPYDVLDGGRDVLDCIGLKGILSTKNIQIIYHLAAEAIVTEAFDNPYKTLETNIMGTANILDKTRGLEQIEAIIVASSDKAYGEYDNLPYTEEMGLQGRCPYSVSKSCADLIAQMYSHAYNLPVAVTRCGNIYGPGDTHKNRLIPEAINCLLNKESLKIRSDGTYTRDYIYISDIVDGYIKIAENFKKMRLSGNVFNFGAKKPLTVLEVVKQIKGLEYKIINNAFGEIKDQYLCYSKAKHILGWSPKVNFNEGLRRTIKWHLQQKKQTIG